MTRSAYPPVTVDELYAGRPDTRPKLSWPVIDSGGNVIAWHGDYFDAFDACKGSNDRFIGEPKREQMIPAATHVCTERARRNAA